MGYRGSIPALAVQRVVTFPLADRCAIAAPILMLQLGITAYQIVSESCAQYLALLKHTNRVKQIGWQQSCVLHLVTFRVHIDIKGLAGITLVCNAVKACRKDPRLKELRVGRAIHQTQLKAPGIRYPNHVGSVIAPVSDGIG